jgi:hypothetical protein
MLFAEGRDAMQVQRWLGQHSPARLAMIACALPASTRVVVARGVYASG